MKQLELKHLAPYLPYKIKVRNAWRDDKTMTCYHLDDNGNNGLIFGVKPILYDLSWLTKPITHNGETFVPMDWLKENYIAECIGLNPATWSYRAIEKLIEWRFDVFNLIADDLAIPVTETFNPYNQ